MTRYTPEQSESQKREIDSLRAEIRCLREERKEALAELAKVTAELDELKANAESIYEQQWITNKSAESAHHWDDE